MPITAILRMTLHLSVHMKAYDRALPVLNRQVPIEGVDPIFMSFEVANFGRMLNNLEYDVSEMSFSSYLIAKERGVPITAIPVFPHRRFRHSYIFVDTKGKIKEPRELIGKRIGVPIYQPTALVWIRGILQHEYDVKPEQMKWFYDREKEPLPISPPHGVSIESTGGVKKEKLFLEEKLDALFDSNIPEIVTEGNPAIRRLFQDYKAIESDYHKRTGIFPIMHTIVIKNKLLEEHQWLSTSFWRALVAAKKMSFSRMNDPRFSNLIWPLVYYEEERSIMGKNFWPYNLKDNVKTLETLISYSKEQGFITREPKVEELFAQNTLDLKDN